ncbi:hypothetical protein MNV49_002722 [Pseudohyphozyma bogoriensis]|nr:hypothetical protein MNV49_002722 [Pseudohyphozyma bogoriensis]
MLPNELLGAILAFVRRPSDLARLCRVSRVCHHYATALLYEEITAIHDEMSESTAMLLRPCEWSYDTSVALPDFVVDPTVPRKLRFRSWIHELRRVEPPERKYYSKAKQLKLPNVVAVSIAGPVSVQMDRTLRCLAASVDLANVHELTVEGGVDPLAAQNLLELIAGFPNLRRLSLTGAISDPPTTITLAPLVAHLTSAVFTTVPLPLFKVLTESSRHSLRSLALSFDVAHGLPAPDLGAFDGLQSLKIRSSGRHKDVPAWFGGIFASSTSILSTTTNANARWPPLRRLEIEGNSLALLHPDVRDKATALLLDHLPPTIEYLKLRILRLASSEVAKVVKEETRLPRLRALEVSEEGELLDQVARACEMRGVRFTVW